MCTGDARNETFHALDRPERILYIKCQFYTNKLDVAGTPGPLSSWSFSIYNGDERRIRAWVSKGLNVLERDRIG
jgi:hypothetical protein